MAVLRCVFQFRRFNSFFIACPTQPDHFQNHVDDECRALFPSFPNFALIPRYCTKATIAFIAKY